MEENAHEAAEALEETVAALVLPAHLSPAEAAFLQRLARDGVAGRHVLCLLWHFIIGLGKLALAVTAIAAALSIAFHWRVQQ